MTIEEMRRVMREKVVPEEVVPQNVINRLIDEDAEPPKLDAFAFLMRLRTLGIGSVDFLNLLEGCDAPESVVNRIKQNPAMNLQELVLTLESSELTTEDYTRMLLTARQVWERTLTLRLERSEKISRDMELESEEETAVEYSEASEEDVGGTSEEFDAAEETEDTADVSDEDDFYYDEDMQEMSFTAVLDKINEEMRDGVLTVDDTAEAAEAQEVPTAEETDTESEPTSFAEAFDKIKSEKRRAAADTDEIRMEDTAPQIVRTGNVGDTTVLIQIDEESLRESFDKISEQTEETAAEASEKAEEGGQEETDDDLDAHGDREDNIDETDEDEGEKQPSRVYHKGAIICGAVGAAVLIGAGFFIDQYAVGKDARSFHYAEDSAEIFNKIYYAYNDEEPASGGNEAYAVESGDCREIFGDLIIGGGKDNKSFVSFSDNDVTYAFAEEAISVSKTENGTITPLEALIPPEKARFVAAFDDNGKLYAMFSGKQSGFMKISGGKAEFTVLQDGILTELKELAKGIRNDGEIARILLDKIYTAHQQIQD